MKIKNQVSLNSKKIAVNHFINKSLTQKEIAVFFEIDVRTVKRWIKKYREDCLDRKARNSTSYKIKQKHVNCLLKIIQKNPRWSVKMYWKELYKKYNDFEISEGHLAKVIRDNNITRKRTRRRHYPEKRYGKPIDLNKELKTFYTITDSFSLNKLISLDETSIHAQMVHTYSRCELGKRCVHKTKDNKVFVKFTLLVAISSKGIVGWILFKKGGVNSERMVDFFQKFIINKFKRHLIIMDNGGCHKSQIVRDIVSESENQLQYTVPYKPKTNAVESWFSQFKHYYKHDDISITFDQVRKNVKKSITKIKKENYINYMKYAYRDLEQRTHTIKTSTKRKPLKKYKS